MLIRNVSPLGALEIPALGRVVDADELVEVSDELGAQLIQQPDNYVAEIED